MALGRDRVEEEGLMLMLVAVLDRMGLVGRVVLELLTVLLVMALRV